MAYFARGIAYARKRNYGEAVADFTEAIRLRPRFAVAYQYRGLAHKKLGDNANAEEDFAEAKKLGYKAR